MIYLKDKRFSGEVKVKIIGHSITIHLPPLFNRRGIPPFFAEYSSQPNSRSCRRQGTPQSPMARESPLQSTGNQKLQLYYSVICSLDWLWHDLLALWVWRSVEAPREQQAHFHHPEESDLVEHHHQLVQLVQCWEVQGTVPAKRFISSFRNNKKHFSTLCVQSKLNKSNQKN